MYSKPTELLKYKLPRTFYEHGNMKFCVTVTKLFKNKRQCGRVGGDSEWGSSKNIYWGREGGISTH